MLLKALLLALLLFAGGVGILRVSVLLENYLLLTGGMLLSVAAVLLVNQAAVSRRTVSSRA